MSVWESSQYYSAVNMLATITLKASMHPHLCSLRGCFLSSQVFVYILCGVVVIATRHWALLTWLQTHTCAADCLTLCHSRLLHVFIVQYMDIHREHKIICDTRNKGSNQQCSVFCVRVCARVLAGAWHLPFNSPHSLQSWCYMASDTADCTLSISYLYIKQ